DRDSDRMEPDEGHEVRSENQRHDDDELETTDLLREPAVEIRRRNEKERLPCGGVALELRAALENERLTRGLEQIVRRQKQEDAGREQHRARAFAGMGVGE